VSATPVFLAVDEASADLTGDDAVLAEAIVATGRDAVPVVWGRAVPRHATLVVRSTWDYVEHPDRFRAWLAALDAAAVDVHNPTSVLRWNLHKRYLLELGERGIPVVPTVVAAQHERVDLGQLMRSRGWADAVVKPAIGGTARLACHVGDVGPAAAQRHLDDLVDAEDALVQPFVASVSTTGELSVIAIGGIVTHAVRKTAAPGDWRVQVELGGVVEPIDLDDAIAAAARRAIGALPATPLYARVDLVELDGQPLVMELELVEPELFFALAPHAATHMAELLADR
jgi:glutathione synthase/RimK-type ligase-like ATP-grasp enzyme